MKRVDLIRRLCEEGCVFVRAGSRHDVYRNVITGAMQPVPRHREINELTAQAILRALATPETPRE